MKNQYLFSVAFAALMIPGAAFAQSTGSIDFEGEDIVVTAGRSDNGVGGVILPETSKAKAVLDQEFIGRQAPGQTINDIINQLPGVSFQNNDPFGSGGGTLTIRGFDDTRISQTFDGVPLNDSGGYALYSNQQLDPELISQVNVNLGTTDVDSPTAAASGSTVNYRTRLPNEDFGAMFSGAAGEYGFFRIFGAVDTGEVGPWGTRAFFAASHAENDNVYNNRGRIDKQQYNARVYQPLGSNGDFISLAGHYNQNRNNFFGSIPLRTDTAGNRVVPNRFPLTKDERFYTIARCLTDDPQAGVADSPNSCGSSFDERYNPSNTGNIRGASRFTLSDGLVLTVDPSYQYVKANGGGTLIASEGRTTIGGVPTTGYVGASSSSATQFFAGVDLNGDGDTLDTVRVLSPSQTQTHRYGLISSLRYDINEHHTVRLAYSYDRARHRQTGQAGFLDINGEPFDVFAVNNPIVDGNGNVLQKRDRLSYAILHQIAGEYRGEFLDEALVVNAGLRAPFFKRELNNYCFTKDATGLLNCFGTNAAGQAAYAAANPTVQGPQRRTFKYDRLLPNVGLTYNFTPAFSTFANYSKGIQVPGTDNLYNSFFFAPGTDAADPSPETTDNFDLGARYRTGGLQAQVSLWYTKYSNRLASAYDPDIDRTVYRNLGKVDKYGIDGSISYRIIPEFQVYAFGSYLKSEIQDNVQLSGGGAVDCGSTEGSAPAGCALTAGKRESGAPVYTFGGRAQATLGPVEIGVQAKRTGPRYVNDQNLPLTVGGNRVFGAKAPAYTLVDLDARLNLAFAGLNDKTYLQLNVSNVFDELYVGGFDGGLLATSAPFVQIGAPRTFMGSLVVAY
ncbi:iron complex outermembrane receptor protein [Sphingomonas zeicaulis]|uniref:TonB-dependent receptor n=1 Tax=Sphingomonas zeicaulis TaxID=1632740 RepID=UPI003D193651